MPGLIVVFKGNGKGKTTAALGLALRAIGHGHKVGFLQFMKGSPNYGECRIAPQLPNFNLVQCGRDSFVTAGNPDEIDIQMAGEGLKLAEEWLTNGNYDLIVLDEILVAVAFGLFTVNQVLDTLTKRQPHIDLVLTGRYGADQIVQIADTVTEMVECRHAYHRGVEAKAGMEF
jgi:cob(I)alamin adenosyltransferase